MERLNRSEKIFKVIAYLFITVFALLAFYPVYYAVIASISGRADYEFGSIVFYPRNHQFEVYKNLLIDKGFWLSYVNTLFYTVFGTAWSMLVTSMGAYALSKKKLLWRRKFNFFIVFTMWFTAGMIPLYLNYTSMNVDNRWGIVFAFGIQAYNIILLRNYFEGVPKEIEEAALIDGANEFQIFSKIYIPMSKAAMATVTLFYATTRWNGYFWASRLLDNEDYPLQVYLREKIQSLIEDQENFAPETLYAIDSMAYGFLVCSIIPVLIVYPFVSKYFAKGVNLGGVKG